MTLIVGIKCSDGIVLASDGAATAPTIRQPIKRKLRIIDGSLVVGVSGPIGLGQRFVGILGDMWRAKIFSSSPAQGQAPCDRPHLAMQVIRENLWKYIELEMKIAGIAAQAKGPRALQETLSSTIVALQVGNTPCLFQFDEQASPEEATEDLPFISIGSGDILADPFLALLRRLFWSAALPTVEDATLHAVWTIHHAIKANPGGIGEPIQLVRLQLKGNRYVAEEMGDGMKDIHEAIERAEEHIQGAFNLPTATEPVPEPTED